MSVQKVTCKVCGFQVEILQGKLGQVQSSQDIGAMCKDFGSGQKGWCENLDKALAQLQRSQ